MSLFRDSLTSWLPKRSARFRVKHGPMVPHRSGPPRQRVRHTVARTANSSLHALSPPLATAGEFVVFTLSFPSCPGHEFVVRTPPTSGCPHVESVRHHARSRSCPRAARLREPGFPNPRSALHHPVSQIMERAPFMDSEAMKPVRPRSCPRDQSDLTARAARARLRRAHPGCPGQTHRLRHESPAP
jgi:hypothetical protein